MRHTSVRRALVLALALAAAACAAQPGPAPAASPRDEIVASLQASADAWNRGSLEEFMAPYAQDAGTSFVAQDVIRGKGTIQQFYAGSWFRNGRPAGRLAYHDIEVRPLGRDFALVVGHWTVTGMANGDRSGIFSLTWQRRPEGWRIIHDHSS